MPKKSKKSEEVLEKEHIERTRHYVDEVEKWLGKLTKAMHSRKYPLSQAQRERAAAYVNERVDVFNASLSQTASTAEEKFKF